MLIDLLAVTVGAMAGAAAFESVEMFIGEDELIAVAYFRKFCDFEEKFDDFELKKQNFASILTFWRRILQKSGSENPC